MTPLPETNVSISDRISGRPGSPLPPGLRFPSGAVVGTHLIVTGIYVSQTIQSFEIWALHLLTKTWSRVDVSGALGIGSWFRACYWPKSNRLFVFGDPDGNPLDDYNRRLLSWKYVVAVDLEAFGIYQLPPLVIDVPQQVLGLSALEEGLLADFEVVCDDGRKIKCSRKTLEDRWPWLKKQRTLYLQAAARIIQSAPSPQSSTSLSHVEDGDQPDPRLSFRALHWGKPYPVTLAFLQYLYSMALLTPLQHAPAVLSQLLIVSHEFDLQHLKILVVHAMHQALAPDNAQGIAKVAGLCDCRSLQTR